MGESDAITDDELSAIERRVSATTSGPWTSSVEGRDHTSGADFILTGGEDLYLNGGTIADMDFVVHAKQDVPKLLAEIARLKALIPR